MPKSNKFFYKNEGDAKKICLLCQHYCSLKKEQIGICGVNKNTGDEVECLVYGYPSVLHVDPVEKKPLYHFLPNTKTLSLGTVGCNFKCAFCQNHGISQEKKIEKKKYYSPIDIVNIALNNACDSISYTYNEPTIFYPYIRDIAILARQYGLKNVFVSNGFESNEVIADMAGLIDAANIDFKSYDEHYYKVSLGGKLQSLKDNLILFKKLKIWVEITTLVIPDLNDSKEELTQIATFIKEEMGPNTPWHLSAFHPDYKMMDKERTSIESLNEAYTIGKKLGLNYVYIGNAQVKNDTVCKVCSEDIITRKTYITKKDSRKNDNLCPSCSEVLDGVFFHSRQMSVAGTFYSASCEEIKKQFTHFSNLLKQSDFKYEEKSVPRAIIVPHAGYSYSGFTANVAYRVVKSEKIKRVLLIGPSHKVAFQGTSVALFDKYKTPCGDINIDTNYSQNLIKNFESISFNEKAHQEHSTETQAPFIKEYFPNASIVELVYGDEEFQNISKIIDAAIKDNTTFVVISTDLSHFYTKVEAQKRDNICLEALGKLDVNIWNKGCEACGRVGVKAMIVSANRFKFKSKLLDYRTSADVTKDLSRVVGYTSCIILN
jgi:AmmeMemoRadiSam system radical SAM enzyme/AmmeMemoRadiSam system protein B